MPKKRTNVRSLAVIRGLFRILNPMPAVASELAVRIWSTPPRAPLRPAQAALLAQAERTSVEAAGARVATYAWGRGPAVLLVHGWGGHAGQLTSFVPPLLEAGYRVVAFDAPRHGSTSGGKPTIPAFATIAQTLAAEAGGFEAVIAHSMGAAAMGHAMRLGLEAERAVFLAPPISMEEMARRFARMVGLGARALERMRETFERRHHLSLATFDLRLDAPRIRSAALIVHDAGDREVPHKDALELVRAWPRARLLTTEGLGHHRILRDPCVIREAAAFIGARERPSKAL